MGGQLLLCTFMLAPLPGLLIGAPWGFLTPLLTFLVLPILDLILPRADAQATPGEKPTRLLYLYLPYHAFLILLGIHSVRGLGVSDFQFWVNVFSVGIVTGAVGITFAHEWVHKLKPHQRLYGEWLLIWVCYGHYSTEHVYGHHKNVGTREDGATARKNEWLQTFIFRALVQVWLGAFRTKPLRTLIQGTLSVTLFLLISHFFGKTGGLFFFIQAAIAILLLTSIDYVEHYGLERRKSPDGRTESMKPWHSWDSDTRLMGELLIRLQRHADHHMRPTKPYTELVLHADAPKLPTGYGGMIWIAWWPHLWFKIMNPRVEAVMNGKPL